MRKGFVSGLLLACLLMAACSNEKSNKKAEGEPIVLGDPSTIVTEQDTNYLKDLVADLKPTEAAVADSAGNIRPAQSPEPAQPQGDGLRIAFKEVTVFLPGVSAKPAGNTNPEKSNSASYRLSGGQLNGNNLQLTGASISSVSMRYQSGVNIKNNLGTLELDALGTTSGWQTFKGNVNNYNLTGLDPSNLSTARITEQSVRNAISKEARQRRMNRRTQQQWLNSVKNVRSAKQKPLETVLRAVIFKIDGKDKAGKSFSKQVRIDL